MFLDDCPCDTYKRGFEGGLIGVQMRCEGGPFGAHKGSKGGPFGTHMGCDRGHLGCTGDPKGGPFGMQERARTQAKLHLGSLGNERIRHFVLSIFLGHGLHINGAHQMRACQIWLIMYHKLFEVCLWCNRASQNWGWPRGPFPMNIGAPNIFWGTSLGPHKFILGILPTPIRHFPIL